MNQLIFFVLLPMVGIPLMSLATAWIQPFITEFRRWMANDINNDLDVLDDKLAAFKKEMDELEELLEAEEAEFRVRKIQAYTILHDTPTVHQATAVRDEAARWKFRRRELRRRAKAALKGKREFLLEISRDLNDRPRALEANP
ncbi:uncharacterized protein N7479_006552 [Penicillium vulpinum]|uniref:Uncharacterized protein n=1 Tax=Penicillium vulpinum TaxID=29845 RepID=A0A1V6S312_9EURO|nr:uncharacterized protein N7479_006552 [Penicillium vulpinum]KAJ5959402.1 hypothetical protein N7479_006552 [Penicillium vulpinum]OQE08119.1 hypothetical protein PENVUL_c011G07521 [Penicillium vulpinum]